MKRIVSIADMIVSDNAEDTLITYALGPCLGVAVIDLTVGVGGLIHCQLPTAKSDLERAKKNPAQFVDAGVSALLEQMFDLGAEKRRLIVKVAGAAQVMDHLNLFQIAQKNYTILRKLLWKNDLLIHAEDVGGDFPRTMSLEVGSGVVLIQSGGREWELVGSRDRPAQCALVGK
jgi:chemotaxis protein CheD